MKQWPVFLQEPQSFFPTIRGSGSPFAFGAEKRKPFLFRWRAAGRARGPECEKIRGRLENGSLQCILS